MALLVLPVAPVPCTRHLHCARAIASLAIRRLLVSVSRLVIPGLCAASSSF